ncbi:tetratricopeptide repeat protein [Helicobacter sp. MIT 05-5294]|uniref:tetratricopeptide repeat protein n=1 Tax=Helicobacter sp. MIT 05-5294 TaxID=1548150 RepID=UPI00051F9038|nr:tetratricopeptide repeat protein [Helicobacter sp. MIT 05-5294]TLD87830.1 tetratricopeptide repeat protein [Helicobacter sp. MIT 05-5294]
MSLKQNVDFIKEEMSNDEKMLEGLIRFEGWFKRYKIPLIALAVGIVLLSLGYMGNNYYQEKKQQEISALYTESLKGDEEAIALLKDSKSRLYDLYLFQNALKGNNLEELKALESSKDPVIAQFAKAQNASLNHDLSTLDSQVSGDFGYLQAAFLEIQAGKIQEAKVILSKIQNDSSVRDFANALEHLSIQGVKNAQ